ncbi:MAG TPA: imelysin family protein [Gemmatimonadota bacterium]|jgi:putative iron-regulated protein
MSRIRSRRAARIGFALLIGAWVAAGCGDTGSEPVGPGPDFDAGPLLQNEASNVITATYRDLSREAGELLAAVQALQASPTAATLTAAQQAWRETRVPWERSEGFLFGPVSTQGLDPALDSWPVNVVDLDAVLASSSALTKSFIDGLEGTLKGFHTIEYLLFGESGAKTAADFTPREFEYLVATTESLKGATDALASAWAPEAGNFAGDLSHAGESGSVFVSRQAAVQELLNGMITIADEVANGKINDPFSQADVTLEESRFSNNSKADFQDNIRSLRSIYTGDYTGAGPGLDEIAADADPALDARLRAEIDAAIAAIGAIPGTFGTAIFDDPASVQAAQTSVRRVLQTLQEDVVAVVQSVDL